MMGRGRDGRERGKQEGEEHAAHSNPTGMIHEEARRLASGEAP